MPDTPAAGVTADLSKDPFVTKLRETLTSQSGIISSTDSSIESKINEAISGVKSAAEASKAAITSSFDRNIGYQRDQNLSSEASFIESQRGFATNTAAFRSLVDYNRKSINDLEQRKQELSMQGDAAAASKIAELQLSKLEFENKAAQQTFTNLLSLGNFALSQKESERAARAQDFTESTAISNIALKYGLPIVAGETIDSIVQKASPFASAEHKLEMAAQQAQINASNAAAAKALSDINANAPLDDASLTALARAYMSNPGAVSGVVKTTAQLGQILTKVGAVKVTEFTQKIASGKTDGVSKQTMVNNINTDTGLSPTEKVALLKTVEDTYGPDSVQAPSGGLPAFAGAVAKGTLETSASVLDWLTGQSKPSPFR